MPRGATGVATQLILPFTSPFLLTAILFSIFCGVGLNFMSAQSGEIFRRGNVSLPFTGPPRRLLSPGLRTRRRKPLLVTGSKSTFPIYMSFLAATIAAGAYSCASTWRHISASDGR